MNKYKFDFDPERCVACGACAVACMDQNDLEPKVPEDVFRMVSVHETGHGMTAKFTYHSTGCRHCSDAPCIEACPAGCLSKDNDTGLTVFDNCNCLSCQSCAAACPFSAPIFNQEGRMTKCDGCNTRVKNGLEPACVMVCPYDALKFSGPESPAAQ